VGRLERCKGWHALPSFRQVILPGILAFLLSTISLTARAQTPESQSVAPDTQTVVRLPNTRHPFAAPANAMGRAEAGHSMRRMLLVLSPSAAQKADLQKFLDDQHNRNSPNYHHWLTAAEFGRRFGASDADVEKLRAWLARAGFVVERAAAGKRWIEFGGTAAQVESAFLTEMHYYRVRGKTYLANSTDLAVPVEFAGITRGVLSLNNFGRRPPIRRAQGAAGRDSQGRKSLLAPNLTAAGATNTYYLAPGDFAAIYNTKGLLSTGIDGSGVSIAVAAQSQIELTDVQKFRQIFGLKANDPNILVSGPDPGIASLLDAEEALLDVEWAGAVAPGATIDLVVAGSTDTTSGVDLAASYAIDNEVAPILTYTYGGCEQALGTAGNAFYNALWQQAAAEGITVLVAAGDNGAAGCDNPVSGNAAALGQAVSGSASTPYNVAVGGTQFAEGANAATLWSPANSADYSSALGYIPEQAWNESCDPGQPPSATNCLFGTGNLSLLSTGGGASTVYSKPSWQSGTGVPVDGARDLPDVALAAASAHDDFVYCTSLAGTPCQIDAQQNVVGLTLVGGTSASTPAMAGILALVEQKNGAYQGQVNYVLYRLAEMQGNRCDSTQQTNPTAQNSCVFYDITSGSNAVPCLGGSPGCSSTQSGVNGFLDGATAGTGYDLATGLGSVNASNLATAWNSATLADSQTTLQMSALSFPHGTAITVSGTVAAASGSGTPTGAVSIKTDLYGDSTQIVALGSAGAFSGAVSDLPGGQYNVYAHYAGDATYSESNSSVAPLNVSPEDSLTTLTVSGLQGNTAGYGDPLPLKVKVAGVSGNGIATGSVTIQDGASVVGIYALGADGSAYIPTGGSSGYSLAPGTHNLTAVYPGDNSFNASTSAAVSFTVGKGTPFVVVGVNTPSIAAGGTIGAHAVVSSSGTVPATGTVQFTVDGAAYGSPMALQTGGFFGTQAQASILLCNLTQGTHVVGASYDGSADPNYVSVASGDPSYELTQSVTVGANVGTQSTTTLAVSTAPVKLGDTGVFTVSVTPSTATGTVTVWDAVGPRSAAFPILSGSATISFPWTQAGSAMVYAVYSGDGTNTASASTASTFTVQRGIPQVKITAPTSATANQQIRLTASVIGNPANSLLAYPTGVAELWDTGSGASAQLLAVQNLVPGPGGVAVTGVRLKLAAGTHNLYWHYRGDTNWMPADSTPVPLASATFSLGVSPTDIILTAGSSGSSTVTITPIGGFAGTVALTCATGGTFVPAGYACAFAQANVPVSSGAATTTVNLTPTTTAAAAVKTANTLGGGARLSAAGLFLGLGLLGFVGLVTVRSKATRNFALASGLVLVVASTVLGCGAGGGGGGGPVTTTTTLNSSNAHVGYGTAVTFTVTVRPNGSATPTGPVQLYDNGQAYGSPANVTGGIATFVTLNLPVGVHTITAQYGGDATTLGSTSTPLTQTISGTIGLQISGSSNGITQVADISVIVN
jgi:hypothetical protein